MCLKEFLQFLKKDDKMNICENWVGLEDAAMHLGVTKDTVRSWIKKTDIPAHKIGKMWKFRLSELDEWVNSGRSANICKSGENK